MYSESTVFFWLIKMIFLNVDYSPRFQIWLQAIFSIIYCSFILSKFNHFYQFDYFFCYGILSTNVVLIIDSLKYVCGFCRGFSKMSKNFSSAEMASRCVVKIFEHPFPLQEKSPFYTINSRGSLLISNWKLPSGGYLILIFLNRKKYISFVRTIEGKTVCLAISLNKNIFLPENCQNFNRQKSGVAKLLAWTTSLWVHFDDEE